MASCLYEEPMRCAKFIRRHTLKIFVHVQRNFGPPAYTDVPWHTRNVFQRTPSMFQRMSAYAQKVHTFLICWLYMLECDSTFRFVWSENCLMMAIGCDSIVNPLILFKTLFCGYLLQLSSLFEVNIVWWWQEDVMTLYMYKSIYSLQNLVLWVFNRIVMTILMIIRNIGFDMYSTLLILYFECHNILSLSYLVGWM